MKQSRERVLLDAKNVVLTFKAFAALKTCKRCGARHAMEERGDGYCCRFCSFVAPAKKGKAKS